MEKKLIKRFMKKNQKDKSIIVIKNGDELYVNWKDYDNSFNSGTVKKHIT